MESKDQTDINTLDQPLQKTDQLIREIGFLEAQVEELTNHTKSLEYDLAEMIVENNRLFIRVKNLANRTPAWPKGYRPYRKHNHKQ
tara:strand:+ start:50 stop:307 length:258 start_codon:yes stop_codon:yes gene_type:complete